MKKGLLVSAVLALAIVLLSAIASARSYDIGGGSMKAASQEQEMDYQSGGEHQSPWDCVEIDERGSGYRPAPSYYLLGDTIRFSANIKNNCHYPVKLNPIMYYQLVEESCGDDLYDTLKVKDEKKLDYCHQTGNDVQEVAEVQYKGMMKLMPGMSKKVTFRMKTDKLLPDDVYYCNYYQIDMGRGINNRHDKDDKWAWGFARVCNDP